MSAHDIGQLSLFAAEGDAAPAASRRADRLEPPDAAARDRIRDDLDSTLFVEAGAGAGKTTALVGRIVSLLERGTDIGAIAAITFTEKAAAELRHRLRVVLLERAALDGHARWPAALGALDHAPIGTLHAFARRLLLERPVEAGLPPGFGVLDEMESQLTLDERWEDLLDHLLDDAGREVAPGLTAAELVQLCDWGRFGGTRALRQIVEDFQSNWDLVEERVDRQAPPRPALDVTTLVRTARAVASTPTPPDDRQAALLQKLCARVDALEAAVAGGRLRHALDDVDAIRDLCAKPRGVGNKTNWKLLGSDALEDLRDAELALSEDAAAAVRPWREYRRRVVGAIVAEFVLDGALERAASGALEFHDLLVLARRLLTRNAGARRQLHERYQRVLLDEFQDTDPIQLEIAVRLTAPPDDQTEDASVLRPVPGRLFVVGDPKQSIYRFRRADIAAYLRAAGQLGADVATLSANFRSTSAVIEWVNGVFGEVIVAQPDVQPSYGPLDVARAAPHDHGTVTVLGPDVHVEEPDAKINAEALRDLEAAEVAAAVATALRDGWLVGDGGELRPCRPGDVAILLPARTALPMLEKALRRLAVPYRAENAAVVYVADEIRHLLLTLRAAADPTDELSLVAALRSPLYGCSDVELFDWRQAGGRISVTSRTPDGFADHPVAEAIDHVRSLASHVGLVGPAELLDAIVTERRVLETALAGADARDVWRRIRYVVDQARAWTDAGGRGVRRYLRWAAYQAGEGRASDTILPERDHDAVRIMTVHAAKGLEFPITIVAGMTTQMSNRSGTSVAWFDGTWTLREKGDALFEAFQPLDEQMGDAERRRLLYVACTRAVDHLVVSLHRKAEKVDTPDGTAKCTSATVLATAGAHGHGAGTLAGPVEALVRPVGEPLVLDWSDPEAWEQERRRVVAAASVRSATSATRLAGGVEVEVEIAAADEPLGPGADDGAAATMTIDAGLDKDPVDLDLPPWQRGRYGTAIGRAVHAVLQDADLVDGSDIDVLAAAQCAAEGILDLEPLVASLARSALQAPIVRAAAAGAEHWRELFVVAPLGTTVLEGYIDLLVRTPQGLVIVDYKTDQWTSASDRAARIGRYRRQLAAYGVALEVLLDEPIVGGVLVRCIDGRAAEQHAVAGWEAACAEVAAVATVQSG